MSDIPNWLKNGAPIGWGLEPAMHGDRDYLFSTGHRSNPDLDYKNFKETGATLARTGLRTRVVNPFNGDFDFTEPLKQAASAKKHGINLFWDITHYDFPRDIKDPFSDELYYRIRDLTLKFIEELHKRNITDYGICVFNEIEFWSMMVNDDSGFMLPPLGKHKHGEWRKHCIRLTIEIMREVTGIHPNIPFLVAEPGNKNLMRNFLRDFYKYNEKLAKKFIVGINAYPHSHPPMSNDPNYFKKLAESINQNYPDNYLIFAETGFYGEGRVPWLLGMQKVLEESPVSKMIWYPALNHESWVNPNVIIDHGGWDQDKKRTPYRPLINAVKKINSTTKRSILTSNISIPTIKKDQAY